MILFIISLFFGCGEEKGIDKSRLAHTYVDLTVARERYNTQPDSLREAEKDIFDKYNLTEEEYDEAVKSIKPESEYWKEFFDITKQYLDSLRTSQTAK